MKLKFFALLTALALLTTLLTGCTASAADIGRDAALEAALNDAGVTEDQTTRIQISEDSDNGNKTYDIRFDVDNKEYDYEILASDGKIISSDIGLIQSDGENAATEESTPSTQDADTAAQTPETPQDNNQAPDNTTQKDTTTQTGTQQSPVLSLEEATQIALDQVPGSTAQDIIIKLDRDDGQYQYEGELIHEQVEYEFEIDGDTGAILEWKEEPQNSSHHTTTADVDLTLEEAIQIALDRVPGATEQDIIIELDRDDGKYKYEGNIIHEQVEYDFEIDANTGTILEWSEDR